MKTDAQLAQACSDIYDPTTTWTGKWDIEADVVGVRSTPDGDSIVCFRGSADVEDWFRDFESLPIDTPIGHVHSGFYAGMSDVFIDILATLQNKAVYVTGHSLGAARAWIFGALLVKAGFKPHAIVPIAPPRPGFSDFCNILTQSGVRLCGYQNGLDPVPHVPLDIPPFFNYMQPVDLMKLNVKPAAGDDGILAWHHIALYMQGIANLP